MHVRFRAGGVGGEPLVSRAGEPALPADVAGWSKALTDLLDGRAADVGADGRRPGHPRRRPG